MAAFADQHATPEGACGEVAYLQICYPQVALHELPPGVTPHLATSVEFVGRAVRLLRAPPASAKLKQLQQACTGFAGSSINKDQWCMLEQPQQHLLPHEDTLAFAQALRVLQQQPVLSQAALERTVEAIRADVSGGCWPACYPDPPHTHTRVQTAPPPPGRWYP